jgi:hypothetical protein
VRNVFVLARDVIELTMARAVTSGRHVPDGWKLEGMDHHIRHADDHIDDYWRLAEGADDIEEALEHALVRCVMALWSFKNGIDGDNGPDGISPEISG